MQRLTFIVGGILALIILAILYRLAVPSDPSYISPAAYESYIRAQERAEALDPIKTLAGATWWAFLALLPVGAIWWAITVTVDRQKHRRPDERGLLPIDAADASVVGIAALQAHHQAQLAAATRPILPHTLTYAPKMSNQTGTDSTGLAAAPAAISVPSLADLLAAGTIGRAAPDSPMILGYGADGPIMGSWKKLYSCAVGGIAGSGKSSTISFLLAQSALRGARLYLIDPHSSDAESLSKRLEPIAAAFAADPADDQADISRVIRLVANELERRRAGHPDRSPVVLAVDEYSSLIRGSSGDELGKLVESIAQQGRKLGVYAQVGGQIWTGSRSGGSETRDSLASFYVHRCRPAQARYMTGLLAADLPDDLIDLAPGEGYLLDVTGELQRVRMPHADEGSMAAVGRLLTDDAPTLEVPRQVPGNRVEVVLPAHPDAVNLTIEEQRIVERILAGETIPDVCRAVAGTSNGRAYSKAQVDVASAIRKALGGQQ